MSVRIVAALCFLIAAFGAGCGDAVEHDALERQLLRTRTAICDGDCRTYRAVAATCERAHGAARFRLCRVTYASGDKRFSETVCAGLNREGAEVARPRSACRP
jgi:hypothetical protein